MGGCEPPEQTLGGNVKPSDFIHVLENPDALDLTAHDDGGRALLGLLAHTYFADGRLDESEIAQMRRLAGVEDVTSLLEELRQQPLDIAKLGELFSDPKDRDDIVTLVEHAVWGDNDPDDAEWDIIDKLVEGLGIERG